MQCSGGLLAELINLTMLSTRTSVEYCIMFFVSFHVLVAIDNIYAEGMTDIKAGNAIHMPIRFKRHAKDFEWSKEPIWHRLIYIQVKILSTFYNVIYYYFAPYFVFWGPYIAPGSYKDYKYLKALKQDIYESMKKGTYSK